MGVGSGLFCMHAGCACAHINAHLPPHAPLPGGAAMLRSWRALVWRAMLCVGRARVALALQVGVPCLFMVILVFLSTTYQPMEVPAFVDQPVAMPSAGMMPMLQSMVCNGMPEPNATATAAARLLQSLSAANTSLLLSALANVSRLSPNASGVLPPCLAPSVPQLAANNECACRAVYSVLQEAGAYVPSGPSHGGASNGSSSADARDLVHTALEALEVALELGELPLDPDQTAQLQATIEDANALVDLLPDPSTLTWASVCVRRHRCAFVLFICFVSSSNLCAGARHWTSTRRFTCCKIRS